MHQLPTGDDDGFRKLKQVVTNGPVLPFQHHAAADGGVVGQRAANIEALLRPERTADRVGDVAVLDAPKRLATGLKRCAVECLRLRCA